VAYAFGFEPGTQAGDHIQGMRLEFMPDAPPTFPIADDGDTLQAMDRLPKASMLAVGGPDLGVYTESFATLTDDEQLRADLDALLSQFDGPYSLGVTTPAVRVRGRRRRARPLRRLRPRGDGPRRRPRDAVARHAPHGPQGLSRHQKPGSRQRASAIREHARRARGAHV
jgi:hypothetical protein